MDPEPSPAASPTEPAPLPELEPFPVDPEVERRNKVLADYRKVLLQHKETEAKVKNSARRALATRMRRLPHSADVAGSTHATSHIPTRPRAHPDFSRGRSAR